MTDYTSYGWDAKTGKAVSLTGTMTVIDKDELARLLAIETVARQVADTLLWRTDEGLAVRLLKGEHWLSGRGPRRTRRGALDDALA